MPGQRKPPEQAAIEEPASAAAAAGAGEETGATPAGQESDARDVLDRIERAASALASVEGKVADDHRETLAAAASEIVHVRGALEDALAEPWDGSERQASARLYRKIASVMGTISAIPKSEYRTVTVETSGGGSYSYDFIPEGVLMERIRPALAERGVAVLYSDKIVPNVHEGDDQTVTVEIAVTFADGETGARWTCRATAEGTDKGDKAASKAKTTATRYLLWKTFLVSGDLDPEAENVARRSGGGGGSRGGRPATEKQREFALRVLSEADEAGLRDTDDRRPYDAVQARVPVADLLGPQASWLIDETLAAKKAIGTADLDAIKAKWTAGLNEQLGAPRPPGDFPPADEPTPAEAEEAAAALDAGYQ